MFVTDIRHYWRELPGTVRTAVLVSLIIHIFGFFAAYGWGGLSLFMKGDAVGYVQLGENIANGNGFVFQTSDGSYEPETFRLPGLPALIAFFLWLGFGVEVYLLTITIISAIAIPLMTSYLGDVLFGARTAVIAVWLVTIEPLFLILSWYPLTEIPFVLFALLSLALYVRSMQGASVWNAVGAGASAATAVYMRPAGLALFAVGFLIVAAYCLLRRHWQHFVPAFVAGLATLAFLAPWVVWMHAQTNVYALSGTGWRNVYTDYLASVRTLKYDSNFSKEKELLKVYATEAWNLQRHEINRPDNAHLLRDYAIQEISREPVIAIKLEMLLLVTYFTHTDYYNRFAKLGFLPLNSSSVSASQVLLQKGFSGIPIILRDLQKRYFIPVIERFWAVTLLFSALFGVWSLRTRPITWAIFMVCCTGALTATAIGLGVEGRLRVPILPLYYMLAGSGMLYFYGYACKKWQKVRSRSLHTGPQ